VCVTSHRCQFEDRLTTRCRRRGLRRSPRLRSLPASDLERYAKPKVGWIEPGLAAIVWTSHQLYAMSTELQHIDACVDFVSNRSCRLLNWQNQGDPFWSYGIGISDLHVFVSGRGLRVFERPSCRNVLGVDTKHYPPTITIDRLKHAIDVFGAWKHSLLGWNCEHLARLVQPIDRDATKASWLDKWQGKIQMAITRMR
jgi:hypothetical protein